MSTPTPIEAHINNLLAQPNLAPETVRLLKLAKEANAAGKMPEIPNAEPKPRPVSDFIALSAVEIQRKFHMPYAAAERCRVDIKKSLSDSMVYYCREDEMLVFQRDRKWAATIFWYGPESANLVDQWFMSAK